MVYLGDRRLTGVSYFTFRAAFMNYAWGEFNGVSFDAIPERLSCDGLSPRYVSLKPVRLGNSQIIPFRFSLKFPRLPHDIRLQYQLQIVSGYLLSALSTGHGNVRKPVRISTKISFKPVRHDVVCKLHLYTWPTRRVRACTVAISSGTLSKQIQQSNVGGSHSVTIQWILY